MYRSFTVRNFRGFEELTIDSFERINLLAGKNNVGKTALLEAIWIHHGANNPDLGLRADSFRGLDVVDSENFMSNLFFRFDRDSTIELSAEGDWGDKPRLLKMQLQERPTVEVPLSEFSEDQPGTQQSSSVIRESSNEVVLNYTDESDKQTTSSGWLVERQTRPGVWSRRIEKTQQGRLHQPSAIFLPARQRSPTSADVGRFSKLLIDGDHEGVIEVLKEIEPRLRRLAVVSTSDKPAIYVDIGLGRLLPVPLMGDGMVRLLSLALAIASAPNGLVLIDEVENGLHHTVMQRVWRAIAAFARHFNVQIFATTHSQECIESAHLAFASDRIYDFRLYRLERANGLVHPVKYDLEMLNIALESGLEVR